MLCAVQGRKPEREEFSSLSVSGEKNRGSAGEGGLRLVRYNLSLVELISLDSGPHKPSHTAPRQPRAQAGRGCSTHHAPPRQMPGARGLSEGSQVKPVVSECSQHSLLSHCPWYSHAAARGALKQIANGHCLFLLLHADRQGSDPLQHVISHVAP